MSLCDAAHEHVKRGWPVIPLHHVSGSGRCSCGKGAGCPSPGKHPMWTGWQHRGLTSGADVQAIWDDHPDANIGVVTGAGLVVADLDTYKVPACRASLETAIGERLPDTYTVRTGRGGVHLYYTYPPAETVRNGVPVPGVDVRADGGMVVAPPSVSGSGPYTVVDEREPVPAPAGLLRLLRETAAPGPAEVAAGVEVRRDVPADLATRLADPGLPDRSAHFAKLVADLKEARFCQREAVTLLAPWSALSGKFTGRVAERVAAEWPRYRAPLGSLASPSGSPLSQDPPMSGDLPGRVPGPRTLSLTAASTIQPRPVHWLWKDRLPLGELALIAGKGGLGKSTIGYTLAAQVTTGRLSGVHFGQPRSVVVAATEDSWEHTIIPRLMAAGADLDRVFRVDVTTSEGVETTLQLPSDLTLLERAISEYGVALVLIDPIISRLGDRDTHKDGEVRQALEPLAEITHRTGCVMLGVIHVNKKASADPLETVMASAAFVNVSRVLLYVIADPENEGRRYLGEPKNNLGRTDLPTLGYHIEEVTVAESEEGPVTTGRIVWDEDSTKSIKELIEANGETADSRSATTEGAEWLLDYLATVGGISASVSIKKNAAIYGHSEATLKRARLRAGVKTVSTGFPRQTYWYLPDHDPQVLLLQSAHARGV